jgi:flavin reductase
LPARPVSAISGEVETIGGRQEQAMVTKKLYRDAMARFGAAVSIITSDGPGGRCAFTASAVCSVTDDPPTLLVCMNRDSDSHPGFTANGVLCVNTITPAQQNLSPMFAGFTEHDMEARFAAAGWTTLVSGAPVINDCVVSFDCRIAQTTDVGTHSVFFCEVLAVQFGPVHEGLIYFGRDYHPVRHPSAG